MAICCSLFAFGVVGITSIQFTVLYHCNRFVAHSKYIVHTPEKNRDIHRGIILKKSSQTNRVFLTRTLSHHAHVQHTKFQSMRRKRTYLVRVFRELPKLYSFANKIGHEKHTFFYVSTSIFERKKHIRFRKAGRSFSMLSKPITRRSSMFF